MKKLKDDLQNKMLPWQTELVKQVSSVKGIGKRATASLIITTKRFSNTNSYQQLISYAGLCPRGIPLRKKQKGQSENK